MNTLGNDLKFTFRNLGRSPGFTLVALLTLALGIGACTAIFSIVNGVLLRPLALPDPDHLVSLRESIPAYNPAPLPVNANHYLAWHERAVSFSNLALIAPSTISLSGQGDATLLNVAYVTRSLLPTLGVHPALGRNFNAEEETSGNDRVVILTDEYWRRQFHAAPDVIGRTLMLDLEPHTVVGVLPPLRFPDLRPLGSTPAGFTAPDFLKPKVFYSEEVAELFGRHNYTVIARLKPGATPASAQRELDVFAAGFAKAAGQTIELRSVVTTLQEAVVQGSRKSLLVLLGSVLAVLLIGSVNLASLLLARMEHRRGEAAVRLALGASRPQVLRLALLEPLVLAVAGGLAGLLLASFLLDLLPLLAPANLPRLDEVRLDGGVLTFALVLSALSGLLAGLLPAWRLARGTPNLALATGGRSLAGSAHTGRSHRLLLTVQIALSVVLLSAAGLLGGSFFRLLRAEQGYRSPEAISAAITAPFGSYRTDAQRVAFYDLLVERLAASPAIAGAALSSSLPLQGQTWVDKVWVPGDNRASEERPSVNIRFISADYFQVLGLPLLSGRALRNDDRPDKAVVISRRLAEILWPGQDAIGRRVTRGGNEELVVVGVAADVRATAGEKPVPMLYRSFTDWPPRRTNLVIAPRLDAASAIAALREVVRGIDPAVPLTSVRTLANIADGAVAPQRFQTGLAVVFAFAATSLTALGLFGVVAYSVACRSREFGVRLALGASPSALPRTVLHQYLAPVATGLAAGLAGILLLGRVIEGLLYETNAHDPALLASVGALVLLVSLLACWLPARRAARVDPMIALRSE